MERALHRPEGEHAMKRHAGFSLIELLIVVAIILIIAAIAVPNMLRSKIAANEASAVSSIHVINTAQVAYSSTYGVGYGALANLSTPAAGCPAATALVACLIDSNLGAGTKSGYTFTSVAFGGAGTAANPTTAFNSTAVPTAPGQSGQSSYCSDGSGVVRRDINGAVQNACATSGLPPI
jgi:prepilin-type N-terminal cleavage/methylation domain-containing protein